MTALKTLAAFVPFTDDDLIVTLGDYVDRGPGTREVIDWLIDRHAAGRLVPLRGNHEIIMQEALTRDAIRSYWLGGGGAAVLASYRSDGEGTLSDIPDSHWHFLAHETRRYYETETHFFVHANAAPDLERADQPDEMLFWAKFYDPPPHQSGKTMICGHTAQSSGRPFNIGHAVCIDTWAYGQGWLTCLDPASGEYWQANQRGETRRDRLDSPQ